MDVELIFARGREAADRGNYDYAIAVFRDILRQNPDHSRSRIALRGCEMARVQESGRGIGGALSRFLGAIPAFILVHLPGGAKKRMDRCEDLLEKFPESVYVLTKLASACKAGGYMEAAVNTLEFARQRKPEDMGVVRLLGEVYAQKEDYQRAARCYEELVRRKPGDKKLEDRLRNLSAAAHLQTTKMEESKSYRDQIRDEDKAKALEDEEQIIRTTDEADAAIARLQAQLREDPENVATLVKLGDTYLAKRDYKLAMSALNQAYKLDQRYDIRSRIGNLKIRMLLEAEKAATDAAQKSPEDAELKQKAEEARRERINFAIKEYEDRFKDHPTELPLAHRLGMIYFEEGSPESIGRAIECFQKSVEDPRLKAEARFMLGRCFGKDPKTRDMAIQQYEDALKQVTSPSSEIAKTIQYNLGELYEEAGDNSKALEWYKKVFAVDAAFKDVRQKVSSIS